MKNSQLVVIDWLVNTGHDFLTDIVELEGFYESVPEGVSDAFDSLSEKEKLEVIKESASDLLKNMS